MMLDMKPTIVWIHGFPLSPAIFEKQREIDSVQHVIRALPGFGGAGAPATKMTIDDYARQVVEEFDEAEQAIFAGLSMGGYIALAIARNFPERMSGLILIDTKETADNEEQRKGRYAMIEKVRGSGVQPVIDSMLPKMLTSEAPEEMRERVREIMASSSPEGVIAALEAMATRADSTDLLPKINVPALVVVGAEDTITPPADAERMARVLPNATLVSIPGAGHLSNYEKWERFNRAVVSFTTSGSGR